MLDIVKMTPVVDVNDLIDAMGEIEGLNHYDIFEEIQDMHGYGGGNESYIDISYDLIADCLCDLILQEDEHNEGELDELSDEELLSLANPDTKCGKVNCKLFEMMVKGDLPREFVIHLWW